MYTLIIHGLNLNYYNLIGKVEKVKVANFGEHTYIQGVPKKTLVSVQRLLEALKNELQMKVG